MATWKKVIVSGSNANLTALSVDNLTSGQVVIGGGTGNLSTTAINGTGTIVATTGASGLSHSGSFSGSFQGSFSGTATSASYATTAASASFVTASGVFGPYGANSVTSASYAVTAGQTTAALTFGSGLSTGTFNGSTATTISVTGSSALTSNKVVKWTGTAFADTSLTDNGTVVSGASSIQLTGANSSLTGSFTGSFKGDGSGLTGLATTLTVSGSSGAGGTTVSLGSQTLNIIGTANQIATSASAQTVTISLPTNVTIPNNLTVTGDLYVQGNTTTVNTIDLLVEDQFILLASGSPSASDGGIIIDRGAYSGANVAFGYDADTFRWGYQNGLTDSTNAMSIGALTAGNATNAFAGIVFTQATHGATKPTSGEFLQLGAIYTATDESIWMYS